MYEHAVEIIVHACSRTETKLGATTRIRRKWEHTDKMERKEGEALLKRRRCRQTEWENERYGDKGEKRMKWAITLWATDDFDKSWQLKWYNISDSTFLFMFRGVFRVSFLLGTHTHSHSHLQTCTCEPSICPFDGCAKIKRCTTECDWIFTHTPLKPINISLFFNSVAVDWNQSRTSRCAARFRSFACVQSALTMESQMRACVPDAHDKWWLQN